MNKYSDIYEDKMLLHVVASLYEDNDAHSITLIEEMTEDYFACTDLADCLRQVLDDSAYETLFTQVAQQLADAADIELELAKKHICCMMHVILLRTTKSKKKTVYVEAILGRFLREIEVKSSSVTLRYASLVLNILSKYKVLVHLHEDKSATSFADIQDVDDESIKKYCVKTSIALPKYLLHRYTMQSIPMPLLEHKIAKGTKLKNVLYERDLVSRSHLQQSDHILDVLNIKNKIPYRIALQNLHLLDTKFAEISGEYTESYKAKHKATTLCMIKILLTCNNSFYFNHFYDYRGRTNPLAYHINACGSSHQKAIIEFATEKTVTDCIPKYIHSDDLDRYSVCSQYTDLDYTLISIASDLSVDNISFDKRISYIKHEMRDMQLDENGEHINYADSAIYRYAIEKGGLAVAAYVELVKATKAYRNKESYKTGYMCRFDASSSMLQILGAATGCLSTMRLTGLGTMSLGLVYEELIDEANKNLEPNNQILVTTNEHTNSLTRDDVKKAIISKSYGAKQSFANMFKDNVKQAEALENAYNKLLVGVVNLTLELESLMESGICDYFWRMPDGFLVDFQPTYNETVSITETQDGKEYTTEIDVKTKGYTQYFRALLANYTHSIEALICRELTRRVCFDKRKLVDFHNKHINFVTGKKRSNNFVTLNLDDSYINNLSKQQLVDLFFVVKDCLELGSHEICTNHDCFAVHASGVSAVRFHYKEIIAELVELDIVNYLNKQISTKTNYEFKHIYDLKQAAERIRDYSYYALR